MDNKLKYTQVISNNEQLCSEFRSLMHPYIEELNEHSEYPLSDELIEKWISSILSMQGPPDRHLELCFDGQELIGFLYGKIDHEDHNGFIKPGYGYIMEFFVLPRFRRMGYGKAMFHHMEKLFAYDGARKMYLTPDAVTGVPFWTAMGFYGTGQYSPENQMEIFEKAVQMNLSDEWLLKPLSREAAAEMANWKYEAPYDAYSFKGDQDDYLLDESTWGTEQFCLMDGETVIGQVACQFEGSELWVGWSMHPAMVGKGYGSIFVRKCVEEIRRTKKHSGRLLLRVAAWNQRAIKAYQRAGFTYLETIQDEIAYSGKTEDFWVMSIQ